MAKRHSPTGMLRAPLGHWVIAVTFAVAAAWGMRTWLDHKAVQSAQIATLSWDASAARETDPDLANATQPAVAVAQSILSDSVVARLASSANLPSSTSPARIGEFRSRLELRQSSADLLQVQFHDASPGHAVQTANAVAAVLTAGPPATDSAPPTAATPPAVDTPPVQAQPAVPAKNSTAAQSSSSGGALAHALSRLDGELSETQKKLNSLSSDAWERGEHAGESSSYRESKEQQLLTAQVGAALKEVAGLRADLAGPAEAQESLRHIQAALFSVWPASRAYKGPRTGADFRGFNAAGVNASRLREEREQFTHALDVVRREQAAAQRLESDALPSPTVSESAAAAPPSPAPSASTPPVAESEIPKSPAEDPFHLLRPAGVASHSPLWPVPLAGLCCGVLYLSAVGLRYRRDDEGEAAYVVEDQEVPSRMITPAGPSRPADFFSAAEAQPPDERQEEPARPTMSARPVRSADFFGNAAPEVRLPDALDAEEPVPPLPSNKPMRSADFFASPAPPPAADASGSAESASPRLPVSSIASPAEVIPPEPRVERASTADEKGSSIIDQEITMAAEETKRPLLQGAPAEGEADPWVDNIMKGLSETSIGRMFEKTAPQDRADDPAADPESRRLHPDRLAG